MNILVVGATGKTGRPLVEQLLGKNHKVRIIVRSPHKLPADILENPNTTVIEASILDLTDAEMTGDDSFSSQFQLTPPTPFS